MKKNSEAEVAPVAEYDGIETVYTILQDGRSSQKEVKVNLSSKELKEWLGDVDTNRYFKNGKVPVFCKKAFGDLLTDDNEEKVAMQSVLKDFDGLLFFKNRKQNLYTILVPKELSEFELDSDGEFIDSAVHYDIRTINFSGGSAPSAFEIGYFKKYASPDGVRLGIIGHFHQARQKRMGIQ